MSVRTYPVKLGGTDGMPQGLFDPRWQDPAVAARVAFTIYCRVPFDGALPPLHDGVVDAPTNLTDARTFALTHVHEKDGVKVKGGSYGELHRRYAFGTHTANFHAQAVAFAVDDTGRYLLTSVVGRFDGPWGNECTLAATFFAGAERLGAAVWKRAMDPTGDHRVVVAGRDAKLAAAFARIDRAEVAFVARTGVAAAPVESAPKLSRAKKSALEAALKQARAKGDAAEVGRLEAVLAAGGKT